MSGSDSAVCGESLFRQQKVTKPPLSGQAPYSYCVLAIRALTGPIYTVVSAVPRFPWAPSTMTTGDDIELQKAAAPSRRMRAIQFCPDHFRFTLTRPSPPKAPSATPKRRNASPFYAHGMTFQLFNCIAYTQTLKEFYSFQRMEFHEPRS